MGFPSPGSWRSPAARPRGLQVDLKLLIPHLFIQAVFGVPTGYQVLCCPPGTQERSRSVGIGMSSRAGGGE